MYDINKRVSLWGATVAGLIAALSELPQDAVVLCCGDMFSFIHVESDGTVVNIDTEDLDDAYDNTLEDEER